MKWVGKLKKNIDDFTQEEKYIVQKLFHENYSIHDISDIASLSYYEVIFLLRKLEEFFDTPRYIAFDTIEDERVLILSDTHMGSIYENMDYLKEAYQYAIDCGIHTTIHAGDLIQSTMANVSEIYQDEVKQMEHVVSDYPSVEGMKNYILLGNHDYNTLKKGYPYFEILKQRDDFIFLGFKRAYLNWQDQLISICHPAKKYSLPIPSVENFLNLKGHSHKLSYNKLKSVQIPTLSDDFIKNKDTKAGFLVGSFDKKKLEIDSFYFKDSLYEEGPVLVKKI